MKISDGNKFFSFSMEKILKKYGKSFLEMCRNSAYEYFSLMVNSFEARMV